jgi:tripartite-type tricarboxylate transporter receptor subunit TctC
MKHHTPTRLVSTLAALTATLACVAAAPASASEVPPDKSFPSQSIRIVVPFSPGSGSDVIARTIGERITHATGQAVVVENKLGGGGVIGTMAAARAPADGCTILMVANPFVIGPSIDPNSPYRPLEDFTPIAKIASVPIALAIHAGLGIQSMNELIQYAKQHPGKLSYASSGPGTPSQIEMEILKSVAGIHMVEVPYKSSSQALTDVMAGNIAIYPAAMPLALSQASSGRIKILGLFAEKRSSVMPEVPTLPEALGHPAGYVATPLWYGFVAPAQTPPRVVARLRELVLDAMASPEARSRLVAQGAEPINPSIAQFRQDIEDEMQRAAAIAKALGIKP